MLIVIGITKLEAQQQHLVFNHFEANEGFNSREAFAVVATKNDLLWICSDDGFIKYDGKVFTYFKHDNNDSASLTNNYCKKAIVDKRGWIWIITDDDLDIFNPATEKFNHVKLKDELNKTISVLPNALLYDSTKDVVWIGTRKGLLKSDNGSFKLEKISITQNNLPLSIATVCAENESGLWITSGNKIIQFNTVTKQVNNFEFPTSINNVLLKKDVVQASSSYFDKTTKTLWLGMWLNGLIEFNTATKTFNQYFYNKNYKLVNNTINAIIPSTQKNTENILWMSTDGNGLSAFNKIDKKFTCYSANNYTDVTGIKGNTYGLFYHKNRIWIGSTSGFHCLDFNRQVIGQLNFSSLKISLQGLAVSDMQVEKNERKQDEKLWMYLPYRNAYVFNILKNTVENVPEKVKKYLVPQINFWEWYIDSKNLLWISTGQYGLIGYDINADKIISSEKKYFYKDWEWIVRFYEDSKHNIWMGTFKGLYKLDSTRTKVEAIENVNTYLEKNKLPKTIVDITEDENKNIWFIADGTDEKKALVLKLNTVTNVLTTIFDEQKQANTFSTPIEFKTICSDKQGKVFVSAQSEGLVYFNTNVTGLQNFQKPIELHNTNYNLIKTNLVGKVWVQHNLGFSCYNSVENLLANNNFNSLGLDYGYSPGTYFSPQTGNYYIGQLNNISYFDTHKLLTINEQSNLLFTSFKVSNKPYYLSNELEDGKTIQLKHTENMLSISFALLNFTNASQNIYSWKLEGLETNWNTSNNNIAVYNNLAPGKYVLQVKAANSAGVWNEKPIKLTIIVQPPFYKTWWFTVLCLLCIIAITYALIQQRINNIKAKYFLRNKIASDLHDEIGSTLTSINILSNVSKQAMDLQPVQAREMLEQISEQSKNIQQNMSDIVWSIRPDNEKIEDLITRMREYAAQTLEPLNINIKIEADDHLINKILPMQYRKDILLIFKEAINNIAKHANATSVNVQLHNGQKELTLNIVDNGTWKGNNSGTGTKSMKERASKLGGTLSININNGTSIKLNVPLP